VDLALKERRKLTRITAKNRRMAAKPEKPKFAFIARIGRGRKHAYTLAHEGRVGPPGKRVWPRASHGCGKKRGIPACLRRRGPVREAFNRHRGKLFAPLKGLSKASVRAGGLLLPVPLNIKFNSPMIK
jgi:hypothetical protein